MNAHRDRPSRSFSHRIASVIAAVLVAFPSSAVPQEKAPLAQPAEIKAEYLATLSIAASGQPCLGPYSALSALYTGASLDDPLWTLRGVFSTRYGRMNVGASLLFLSGIGPAATTPLTELAMMQAAAQRDCWEPIDTDQMRPIPKSFLVPGFIRDRRDISNGDLEYEAYWNILVQAHYTSTKAFGKAARRDVTYVHLFNEPERYRGEVVHVSGRLIRLRRFDAPDEARAQGVASLYEGWIMTDAQGRNPLCAVFTDLPDGLTVDNERKYNEPVSFDGYFYKRYRYKAGDSKKPHEYRDAPLLIGHSLTGQFGASEAGEEDKWGQNLIWIFLGVVASAGVGVIVLTFWFRYQDRRVRHRLHASRNRDFGSPSE
jgi:hypothetical protein